MRIESNWFGILLVIGVIGGGYLLTDKGILPENSITGVGLFGALVLILWFAYKRFK